MPVWSDAFLSRKAKEAEEELAKALDCIVDRVSLGGANGRDEYTFPSVGVNIRQITWKGKYLIPLTFNELKALIYPTPAGNGAFEAGSFESTAFVTGSGSSVQGEPRYYVYDILGSDKIILYPTPTEDLGNPADGADLWSPAIIEDYLILEYTRLPNLTGNTHRIPTYIRRRLVKAWVLWKAFSIEGKGQDLEASEYYKNKWNAGLMRARKIMNSITELNARSMNLHNDPSEIVANALATVRFPDNYPVRY